MAKTYRVKVPVEPKTDNKFPFFGPVGLSYEESMALKMSTIRWLNGLTRDELPQTEEGLCRAAGNYVGTHDAWPNREEAYVQGCERYLALANLPPNHDFLKLLDGMKVALAGITKRNQEREALFRSFRDPLDNLMVDTPYGRRLPYEFSGLEGNPKFSTA